MRHRRTWWKRKRFWIALFTILGAVSISLWLIHSFSDLRLPP